MALVPAIIAWFLAQAIKCVIDLCTHRETSVLRAMFGSGGMPSSHSSTICAVTTYIIASEGIKAPISSLAIVVAFIVMYDAMNVRRETGKQGKYLNDLASFLVSLGKPIDDIKFKELVGHTPLQVLMGGILGTAVGVLSFYLMRV